MMPINLAAAFGVIDRLEGAVVRFKSDRDLLHEALLDAMEFIHGYVDVNDGDDGQPVANAAMSLHMELQRIVDTVGRRMTPLTGRSERVVTETVARPTLGGPA